MLTIAEVHKALDEGLDPDELIGWVEMWKTENPGSHWLDMDDETDDEHPE